jgi:hypothetical protein
VTGASVVVSGLATGAVTVPGVFVTGTATVPVVGALTLVVGAVALVVGAVALVVGPVMRVGSVFVTGAVTGATVFATGAVTGATVFATGAVTAATVLVTGAVTAATVFATGAVTAATVLATGAVTVATVFATGATVFATGAATVATVLEAGAVTGATVLATVLVTGSEVGALAVWVTVATVLATALVTGATAADAVPVALERGDEGLAAAALPAQTVPIATAIMLAPIAMRSLKRTLSITVYFTPFWGTTNQIPVGRYLPKWLRGWRHQVHVGVLGFWAVARVGFVASCRRPALPAYPDPARPRSVRCGGQLCHDRGLCVRLRQSAPRSGA